MVELKKEVVIIKRTGKENADSSWLALLARATRVDNCLNTRYYLPRSLGLGQRMYSYFQGTSTNRVGYKRYAETTLRCTILLE